MRDIVVIGAPAGGAAALIQLAHAFPPDLPAAIFIVLHAEMARPILLADALSAPGRMRASEAIDGEPLQSNRIYVAADGKHLHLDYDVVHLRPKLEENTCPSIDALFSTAAQTHKVRVVAVLLLHMNEEGSLGLATVREHGGRSISHRNELMPEAPRHGTSGEPLAHHHLPLDEIAPRVVAYVNGENGDSA